MIRFRGCAWTSVDFLLQEISMLTQRRARPTRRRISERRVSFKFASSLQSEILRKVFGSPRRTTSECAVAREESVSGSCVSLPFSALPGTSLEREAIQPVFLSCASPISKALKKDSAKLGIQRLTCSRAGMTVNDVKSLACGQSKPVSL